MYWSKYLYIIFLICLYYNLCENKVSWFVILVETILEKIITIINISVLI